MARGLGTFPLGKNKVLKHCPKCLAVLPASGYCGVCQRKY